jgi:hypothetical protein
MLARRLARRADRRRFNSARLIMAQEPAGIARNRLLGGSNCSTKNGGWPHLIAVSISKMLQFSGIATERPALTAACSTVELLRKRAF